MIFALPGVLAVFFAAASLFISRASDVRHARRRGTAAGVIALAFGTLGLSVHPTSLGGLDDWFVWSSEGLLRVAPAITALVGLLAMGLAPLSTHRRSSIARISLLISVAEAFLSTQQPLVLAVLWTVSSAIGWYELRSCTRGEGWHRVFLVYNGVSSLFFLGGATLLVMDSSPHWAFGMILVAIGIRQGALPVHSWFPRFVERAPMGIVVAFVAPQLGVYAQLELLSQDGLSFIAHTVAQFGAATAVVAAILGAVQRRGRRALAYLIISQTGLVAFGLESHSSVGLAGALLNWQVLALATSGFALALAALEARRGRVRIVRPVGNFAQTPFLATSFLILGFASVGFPLTLDFIAEDLLVQGTVSEYPLLGLALIVATAFNGITVLRAFFYLFTGTRTRTGEPDLSRRERTMFGIAIVVLVLFGLVPGPVIAFENPNTDPAAAHSHSRVGVTG